MTNLFDLTGSRAIVTGGTRGLGHGMAEGLMEAGASVVIFGSSDKVERLRRISVPTPPTISTVRSSPLTAAILSSKGGGSNGKISCLCQR